MRSTPALLVVVLLALCPTVSSQVDWAPRPVNAGPNDVGILSYDSARGVTVYWGQSGTWEWDGSRWRVVPTATRPALFGYRQPSMGFDALRRRTVLIQDGQTWLWDGVTWTLSSAVAPVNRGAPMVFDSGRGRLVLYGAGDLSETWEWDGVSWRSMNVAGPGKRFMHTLAYDPVRQRTVTYGGLLVTGVLSNMPVQDTWEWDGATWVLREAQGPTTQGAAAAFDTTRGRVVMFSDRTWEWTGSTWQELTVATQVPLTRGAIVHDAIRGSMLFFGNAFLRSNVVPQTFEWDGTTWTRRPHEMAPLAATEAAMVYDRRRDRVVLFGGIAAGVGASNFWEWRDGSWTRFDRVSPSGPMIRGHAMAYDELRREALVFGGDVFDPIIGTTRLTSESWSWNGTGLPRPRLYPGPSARRDHAMAFDAAREQVVLFGGFTAAGAPQADTWVRDWSGWTPASVVPSPPPRQGHAMAYDRARQRVVLFGGASGSTLFGDTWEWDGATWTRMQSATSPSSRTRHAMAYDARRGVVVLHGGQTAQAELSDVWEWDGQDWRMRSTPQDPGKRAEHAMTYDLGEETILLFGGTRGPTPASAELWEYAPTARGSFETFGAGCQLALVPTIDALAELRPHTGLPFTLVLEGLGQKTTSAAMMVGASDQQSGGVPLPYDLTAVGIWGCTLYVSGELFVPLAVTNQRAELAIPFPDDARLVGAPLFAQGFFLDTMFSTPRVLLSNAAKLVLGGG